MRTRFLIVDDSDLVRRSLRMVLQANPDWENVAKPRMASRPWRCLRNCGPTS